MLENLSFLKPFSNLALISLFITQHTQYSIASDINIDTVTISEISPNINELIEETTISQSNQDISFIPHKEAPEIPESSSNYSFYIKCFDLHRNCRNWANDGECKANPYYMHESCAYSCNTCSKQSMKFRYEHCTNTWESSYNHPSEECYNWASQGYCSTDSFMKIYCRRACNFCDFERRCNPSLKRPSALDLNEYSSPNLYFRLFFNRILSNSWLVWKYGIKLVNLDPPVIYFDHIIPEIVADQFIIHNQNEHYKRSVDVIGTNDDGSIKMNTTQGRTSKNAWCGDSCQEKNSTQVILESMEEITGIPKRYYEDLQMLIYNKSNYYHYHHDFIESQADGNAGGRILTFFVYLNNVEMGGETKFPQLKLKVKPKKGSAVLWPNVKNNNMRETEPKTHHTALPVIKGIKYGANAWVHLHDWVDAIDTDCTS